MKFMTHANLFGLGAGSEFDADLTEFLQGHIDSGLVSAVGGSEEAGDTESGSVGASAAPGGPSAQPSSTEPAESVSVPAKKAVSRGSAKDK